MCAARCAAASPRSSKASRARASSYFYHGLGTLRLPPPALLLATEGGRRDGGGLMDLGDSEGLDARPVGAFLMPTDGLLGLVVGVCERRRVPPWPCPVGGDARSASPSVASGWSPFRQRRRDGGGCDGGGAGVGDGGDGGAGGGEGGGGW